MAEALARRDDVRLALWSPPGEHSAAIEDAASSEDAEWLRQLLESGGVAHVLRTNPLRGGIAAAGLLHRLRRVYRRYGDADVIHVNWLQNALPLWSNKQPAVISILGSGSPSASTRNGNCFAGYAARTASDSNAEC